MDLDLFEFFLRKKLTVIGINGHTQGVRSAINPPPKPRMKMYHHGAEPISEFSSPSGRSTGAQRSVPFSSTPNVAERFSVSLSCASSERG